MNKESDEQIQSMIDKLISNSYFPLDYGEEVEFKFFIKIVNDLIFLGIDASSMLDLSRHNNKERLYQYQDGTMYSAWILADKILRYCIITETGSIKSKRDLDRKYNKITLFHIDLLKKYKSRTINLDGLLDSMKKGE